MSFKDYSATPSANTALGDGTYIGPNMLRNKVRPALQQLAADGRGLSDYVQDALTGIDTGSVADLTLRPDLGQSSGAALVRMAQAGAGAFSRTVQDKLREQVHAGDFGLVGDGSDETAKLTAFWNSAIANPGVPHFLDAKTYGVSAPLPIISVSNVWIEGAGAELHDTGTLVTGTVLKWLGSAQPAQTIVDIAPVSGASNQRLSGVFFRYIGIDCNSGGVGRGLSVASLQEGEIDVCTANASYTGVLLGVVGTLGEARDLQRNKIRVNGRQIEAPGGYTLILAGDAGANVSLNEIEVDAQLSNAPAVLCMNSDNNNWPLVRCFKGSGTAAAGMVLQGGASEPVSSRGESFWFYSGNVPIEAKGTADYAVASKGNVIQRLDTDNNTPAPILGAGAVCIVRNKWLTFTPVIAATTGAITTSSATCEYLMEDGGLVVFSMDITITTNGTGSGVLTATLPKTAAAANGAAVVGHEGMLTGKGLTGRIAPGTDLIALRFADGTYPGANGHVLTISGSYRAAV